MLDEKRFGAAWEKLDEVADALLERKDVQGVFLGIAPDDAELNPGGPAFLVVTPNPEGLEAELESERQPLRVETEFDSIEIIIERGELELDGHTADENPMKPGARISHKSNYYGTLGARLSSSGSGDQFLTAGHVVKGSGTDVYQSSFGYAKKVGRPARVVGEVIDNSYLTGANDAAVVEVDSKYTVSHVPHDSPPPSRKNPAVGLYHGRYTKGPIVRGVYIQIASALASVGASMTHTKSLTKNDIGARVAASGATSSAMEGEITHVGKVGLATRKTVEGFLVKPIKGHTSGDSGAVSVLIKNQTTAWIKRDPGIVHVIGSDYDPLGESIKGLFPGFDALVAGTGGGFSVGGKPVDQKTGRDFLAKLRVKLLSLLKLKIEATAKSINVGCKNAEADQIPQDVDGIVVRADQPFKAPKGIFKGVKNNKKAERNCCTFGTNPAVIVTGEGLERAQFQISINKAATVKILFEIDQKILSAGFHRTGECYNAICSTEVIDGDVYFHRTVKLEISGVIGEVDLPNIGKITAGKAAYTRGSNRHGKKHFTLTCSPPKD